MTRTSQNSWPAAATIIAAMIGAAAASIALAMAPNGNADSDSTSNNRIAIAREIGEVKARLEAIEIASRQMRIELRDDIKELRKLMQASLEGQR